MGKGISCQIWHLNEGLHEAKTHFHLITLTLKAEIYPKKLPHVYYFKFVAVAIITSFDYIPENVESRSSSVGIATGYGLDSRGVGVREPVGSRIFTSSYLPDWIWGAPSLLSKGNRGTFLGDKVTGA
jgi:hypothetical protein